MSDLFEGDFELSLNYLVAVAAYLEALGSLVCVKTVLKLVKVLILAAHIEVRDG